VINDVYDPTMTEMRTTFRVIPQSYTINGGVAVLKSLGNDQHTW